MRQHLTALKIYTSCQKEILLLWSETSGKWYFDLTSEIEAASDYSICEETSIDKNLFWKWRKPKEATATTSNLIQTIATERTTSSCNIQQSLSEERGFIWYLIGV